MKRLASLIKIAVIGLVIFLIIRKQYIWAGVLAISLAIYVYGRRVMAFQKVKDDRTASQETGKLVKDGRILDVNLPAPSSSDAPSGMKTKRICKLTRRLARNIEKGSSSKRINRIQSRLYKKLGPNPSVEAIDCI